jgi:hypothetical protein
MKYSAIFWAIAAVIGIGFWASADWWVYVGGGETRLVVGPRGDGAAWPKFKLGLLEQFLVSSVVGIFSSAVITLLIYCCLRDSNSRTYCIRYLHQGVSQRETEPMTKRLAEEVAAEMNALNPPLNAQVVHIGQAISDHGYGAST